MTLIGSLNGANTALYQNAMDALFHHQDQVLQSTINELIDRNKYLVDESKYSYSHIAFKLRGEIYCLPEYIPHRKKIALSFGTPPLSFELHQEGETFMMRMDKRKLHEKRIGQALKTIILKTTGSFLDKEQQLRDTLPDEWVELIPTLRHYKRKNPLLSLMDDDPRFVAQFERSIMPLVSFYVMSPMIF